MNILFNGLYSFMFNNNINCTSEKEVWSTIQTLSEQVRENKMQLSGQQYEYFHFKSCESFNNTFSRFQKLLNAVKLYQ